ncbi:ribosome biogenesis GTPase Der [Estrella lausannensis]|uniref:GTPase Der n=1 Tax=Estrella lausannensis TaxID=483423 RepID=A0A0H5DS98_9BACT|nr:ribosome biogenesis GTPase Der [Estrella lausannensis]CRX39173.1 GTPase Der [Estrella lausannensis]
MSKAPFNEEVKRQAKAAIVEADSLIMVVDGKIGATELDLELADLLLQTGKPVCLAVNKVDDPSQTFMLGDFYKLGISKVVAVSAAQNWQIAELLEAALAELPEEKAEECAEVNKPTLPVEIAIVGRPNVGKSSLINKIIKEDRMIVSPIPGTTRDSIDIPVVRNGREYLFIDTAGIRKKNKEHEVVDKFAFIRTKESIDRCSLALLLIDATEGMTFQEKRIANMIEEAGKGCIILINKWDLVKEVRMEHFRRNLEELVPFLRHCPMLFISAKSGRNLEQIFPLIEQVATQLNERISTHRLNTFLQKAMQLNHPPLITGKRLRIYYLTQVETAPPRFVLFVNYADLLTQSYKKYIFNQFRKEFGFQGVPLIIHIKDRLKQKGAQRLQNEVQASHPQHSVQDDSSGLELDDDFEAEDYDLDEELEQEDSNR